MERKGLQMKAHVRWLEHETGTWHAYMANEQGEIVNESSLCERGELYQHSFLRSVLESPAGKACRSCRTRVAQRAFRQV